MGYGQSLEKILLVVLELSDDVQLGFLESKPKFGKSKIFELLK